VATPVYDSWRLASLSPLPGWALALCAVAAGAATWLAWRGIRSEPSRGRRTLLVALRAASAALALFLLAEPAVQLLQTARVRRRFAVLVDASRSMGFPVEAGGPTRAEAVSRLLASRKGDLAALGDRVDVEWWTFAGDASPADAGGAVPAPRGGRTDLLAALRTASAGSRKLAGALLISDGADNATLAEGLGGQARAELKALGFPVNVVTAGAEAPRDVAIERVAVDDFAFVRNTLTVEATLRVRGYSREEVEVVLRREGSVAASAKVRLEPGRDRYTVPLSFAPDATGTFVFTVEARPLPGDAIAGNNARSFALRVIRDRVRVLLVAGRPSWDERFLRGLLKQDPNVDLVSFFILRQNVDNPGPQEELSLIPFPVAEIFGPQLKTFDAVLFVNFAWSPYRSLQIEGFLPGIRDYVLAGGAFAMVGGEQSFGEGRYGETPIAEILPAQPLDGSRPVEEELRPRLTAEGRRHPVMRLAAGDGPNAAAWEALPALPGLNLLRPLPPGQGAAVLLEAPGILVDGKPAPVVAVREVGRGRALAVATDSSWYWGFLAAESGRGGRAHQRFWLNALRWLVRDPGTDALQVEPDERAVEPGAPVGLTVSLRGADAGPAAGKRIQVELVGEDGRPAARGEALTGADGEARLELTPPGPGAYRIVARADSAGSAGSVETGSAAVAVRGTGPEDADAAPRPELLRAIAEATGGARADLPGAALPELALQDPEVVEIGRRKDVPIWDRGWYLAALAATLAAEWILRRRFGYW
jgi:uncharacterized membrane protein